MKTLNYYIRIILEGVTTAFLQIFVIIFPAIKIKKKDLDHKKCLGEHQHLKKTCYIGGHSNAECRIIFFGAHFMFQYKCICYPAVCLQKDQIWKIKSMKHILYFYFAFIFGERYRKYDSNIKNVTVLKVSSF